MLSREVIKKFTKLLDKEDIVIFIGNELCKEAYLVDSDSFFYMFDNYSISLAIGVASALPENTRVFVVVDDKTILEDINSVFQMYLSNNVNLFLIFLYDIDGFFKSLKHVQGVFFNIGVQSFVIDNYFNSLEGLKKLKNFLKQMKGPKVYSMGISRAKKSKIQEIQEDKLFFRNRINLFINKLTGSTT